MHTRILDRPWDAFDVYLFDIDGTLIHCTDAVHYFAFCHVLSAAAGHRINLEGITAHGNTDAGILRDAFALAGVPEVQWRPQLPQLCESLCSFVDERRSQLCVRILPAVRETLLHLRAQGAWLGVATGNLERIGKRKLQAADLLPLFDLGGWSDSLEQRADVFQRAIMHARALAGADARILAIGDTPADIRAARSNQVPIAAVATGIYSYEELAAQQPDLCLYSLEDLAVSA